jgi:hypothetical protein
MNSSIVRVECPIVKTTVERFGLLFSFLSIATDGISAVTFVVERPRLPRDKRLPPRRCKPSSQGAL